MSENEFEFEGIKYKAVDYLDIYSSPCSGCEFLPRAPGYIRAKGCIASPPCSESHRQDERNVIWVPVEEDEE